MKRHLLPAVAIGLVLLLPTPAFACTPVPAKSWAGNIQIAKHSTASVSSTVFAQNGCEWPDPALNGFDAVVFDVASHKGLPGKVTWNTDTAVKPDSLFGHFRTASCGITGASFSQSASGASLDFSFPSEAKWLIVLPVTTVPGKDISVAISSPGRKCPPPA